MPELIFGIRQTIMRTSRNPQSPQQALVVAPVKRVLINSICFLARVFGFWNKPFLKAEADIENMTLLHKIYWVFKSGQPIMKPDPALVAKNFSKYRPFPGLPESFERSKSATLAAAGDLMTVDGLENSQNYLYKEIKNFMFDADVSYGNLESQLTEQPFDALTFNENEGPPLCCSREQYKALKGHEDKQYTVMHTACNHTMDMGEEGLLTTLSQLESDGIVNLGTHRREEDSRKGKIIAVKGIKIGFVSATFGLNGKQIPEGMEYSVNCIDFHRKDRKVDLSLLLDQIEDCRNEKTDFIIASLHWGYEYEFFPRSEQQKLAHQIIEMGADTIIGHHSHVIQPVEFYQSQRDSNRIAAIAYSLGNLTSPFSAPALVLSQILNLVFCKGVLDGKEATYIESVTTTPVVQLESGTDEEPKILLTKYESLKGRNDKYFSFSDLAKLEDYVELVIGKKT